MTPATKDQVKNSSGYFFPSVFMWFEVLFASDVVSDPLLVPGVFSSQRQEDRLNKRSNN